MGGIGTCRDGLPKYYHEFNLQILSRTFHKAPEAQGQLNVVYEACKSFSGGLVAGPSLG